MIKLHYRPPEIRDQIQDGKSQHMPFVSGGAPLCSDHLEAAETCTCGGGIPVDVRTIILRSVRKFERSGG